MSRMTRPMVTMLVWLTGLAAAVAEDRGHPSVRDYLMTPEAEVALAKSAAPASVSSHATVKVLTIRGYQVAVEGDNDFVCMVLRGWSAAPDPKLVSYSELRAPICFDPVASRTVLPMEELRAELGIQGERPRAIARAVAEAYELGRLPKMESVAFAYMWSARQDLGPEIGAWRPHVIVYAPYYENSMLGGNAVGGSAPFVAAASIAPYSVVVIPVDAALAIE